MIPVQQTRFNDGQGNCLLACVASLLHRKIEDIPDFALSGCGWFEDLYEWCRNESLGLVCLDPKDFAHSICVNSYAIGVWTVVGCAEENHAVVMKCVRQADDGDNWVWQAEMEHDPNPTAPRLGDLVHLLFLVPEVR